MDQMRPDFINALSSEARNAWIVGLSSVKNTLLEELQVSKGMSVLCLCCGAGLETLMAAKMVGKSGRVVGVDFNPHALALAQDLIRANALDVEFVLADAAGLSAGLVEFDRIVCCYGIHLLGAPKRSLLADWNNRLTPNGRLGIASRLSNGPSNLYKPIWRWTLESAERSESDGEIAGSDVRSSCFIVPHPDVDHFWKVEQTSEDWTRLKQHTDPTQLAAIEESILIALRREYPNFVRQEIWTRFTYIPRS